MIVEELQPLDAGGRDDLDRWMSLGRRLRELDPMRFRRALALAWTYVAIYENPDESEEAFAARLELISPSWHGRQLMAKQRTLAGDATPAETTARGRDPLARGGQLGAPPPHRGDPARHCGHSVGREAAGGR